MLPVINRSKEPAETQDAKMKHPLLEDEDGEASLLMRARVPVEKQ